MPVHQKPSAVVREQQWRLLCMRWPIQFSREQLREQYFWYRKSFILVLCGILFITSSASYSPSHRTIKSRRLNSLLDQKNKFENISLPGDSIYTQEEQQYFLKALDESLSYDKATLEFISDILRNETSVTGSRCEGGDTSWKGLKLLSSAFRFPFVPDCDVIWPDTLTLVYIYSRVTAFSQRGQIRTTWANEEFARQHNLTVIFVISLPNSWELQKTAAIEHRIHGDILQVNVPETYDNLAFKSAASLAWISRCARSVPTIVKVDDDSIPNIILLQEVYKQRLLHENVATNLMYCKKLTRINVKRTYNFLGKFKNIVTHDEFSEDFFPPYCQGRVVFMTSDVALSLFNVFLRNEIFRVDDAYMSGLLRSKTCIDITDHYTYNTSFIKPLQWRGLFIDFSVFSATLYAKLGLDITVKTSAIDMPEDLMNEL